ncbi:MAG: flagellar biosynthetic protein FliQ [Sphingomonadales bacterium]|nr:flagellar biosynthetic protein FliQ [Sphingomonadales bacterium]
MDETAALLGLADRMLWTAALVAAPVLFVCLATGLVVGIVQAATSINEQTLSFIPKLAVTAGVLVIFGGAMMGLLGDFTRDILAAIARLGGAGS